MAIIRYWLYWNSFVPLSNLKAPFPTHGCCILYGNIYLISSIIPKTNTLQYPVNLIKICGLF